MTFPFKVVEHVIPGQHIREQPHGTKKSQEAVFRLAVKQYIPLNQDSSPSDDAVTIVGAHGVGFPKEVYEPLWEDLLHQLQRRSIPIRGIWIADCSNHGTSGILNEDIQGDNTQWFDHSRDLLCMINHFRSEMPRPLVGAAHSMGCAQLVHLSIVHPRLFSTLLLYESVMLPSPLPKLFVPNPSIKAATRRDLWPSLSAASSSLRRGLRTWDSRALERYLEFGLRRVPTALYQPNTVVKQRLDASKNKSVSEQKQKKDLTPIGPDAVTLMTTKHQEGWAYSVPNFEPASAGLDRLLLADWPVEERQLLFLRPECSWAQQNLPFLRPSVLWVFGGKSYLSPVALRDEKIATTGTGPGGSGGITEGMVEGKVKDDAGHLLVMEDVSWCAETGAEWLAKWHARWKEEERFWQEYKSKKSDTEMRVGSAAWMLVVNEKAGTGRDTLREKGKL